MRNVAGNNIISVFRDIFKTFYGKEGIVLDQKRDLKTTSYIKYQKARDALGLNNRQVAKAANVPESTIYDWAAQRYLPKADKMVAIGKVVGMTVEELLEE